MEGPSDALPATTTTPTQQFQFPTLEPQRRPQPPEAPAGMSKHGRTNSFFAAFRSQKKNSMDSTHRATVSLDNTRTEQTSMGADAPATVAAAAALANQAQQTQHNQHPFQPSQTTSTTTMNPQRQQLSPAAGYQQSLPPTPPSAQHNGSYANTNGPTGTAGPSSAPPTPSKAQQPAPAPPPLHPEVRSVVGLSVAHAHKIYFSGPLVRRIERQPDGQRPHKDEGWTEVWAQLGGTTLSIWDMKEVQEASRQGTEVPPVYVNVTDAFIQVLGSVTVPATSTSPPRRYTNVLTLNTAGSNLLLFSCPSTSALISWASALRLSAWEKSRLEEIYTAHLIRITLSNRDYPSTLVRGKLEGWAQIRIAGQTDWKRVWVSICEGGAGPQKSSSPTPGQQGSLAGRKRLSLFGNKDSPAHGPSLPAKPTIFMYSGMKPKERKKPILTITDATQVFAVYPERPELIPRSTLIKVEGTFGDEEVAMSMKSREGWALIMPLMEHVGPNGNQSAEMLKWVVALHDAFGLYGRPQAWTWDPRDPVSLMFGYPVGPQKEHLFLDREAVENIDPRDDRTSVIRARLREMLIDFIKSPTTQSREGANGGPPTLPPIPSSSAEGGSSSPQGSSSGPQLPQLPPLSFGGAPERPPEIGRPLTPITERDSVLTHNIASGDNQQGGAGPSSPTQIQKQSSLGPVPEQASPSSSGQGESSMLGRDITHSPVTMSPAASFASNSMLGGFANASTPANQQAPVKGRTSVDSSRTSGSGAGTAPGSSALIQGGSLGSPSSQSFSQTQASVRPLSPSKVSKDKQPERYDDDEELFNRHQNLQQMRQASPPVQASSSSGADDLVNEPGALYYMQQSAGANPPPRQQPVNFDDGKASESGSDRGPVRQSTPMTFLDSKAPTTSNAPSSNGNSAGSPMSSPSLPPASAPSYADPGVRAADRGYATGRPALGRKPSGARAPQPMPKGFAGQVAGHGSSSQLTSQYEDSEDEGAGDSFSSNRRITPASQGQQQQSQNPDKAPVRDKNAMTVTAAPVPQRAAEVNASFDDGDVEALAALAYLDVSEPAQGVPASDSMASATSGPPIVKIEPLNAVQRSSSAVSSTEGAPGGSQFKSSFAPSKQAEERKKKAQAQQAAQYAAVTKPGRANGKKRNNTQGAWAESSDEEEEEEEDDDDVDSDGEPAQAPPPPRMQQQAMQAQQQHPFPQSSVYPSVGAAQSGEGYSHIRPPRTLPQPPTSGGSRAPGSDDYHGPPRQRQVSDHYGDAARRTYYDNGPQARPSNDNLNNAAARQTVWSQVLDSGRPGANFVPPNESQSTRDTFVNLEPSETMTKAFTPQGLLSAGMQDKQDRSAKRQEELARETGASLINVPNKPPPPQTGLLGAITAHERERKREGGVGAALTEREREKRVAEERQRRFDEQQRQQMDQMQQGGSMYGAPFGFNPMMNPMMMGMNPMMGMAPMMTGGGANPMMGPQPGLTPMMTGGGMNPMMANPMMGYGMMPGFNPQHMFAAQQAAQAYQNAMMAFSVAGSQVGGEGGNGGGAPQQNPGMMGAGNMGAMGGFDPRMSMNLMGMGMMGGMGGMPPMGNPQMLGPQGTGMSQFDPRFAPPGANGSPGGDSTGPLGGSGNVTPLNTSSNQNLSTPNSQFASGSNSPIGRGSSPLRQVSRPTTPKV